MTPTPEPTGKPEAETRACFLPDSETEAYCELSGHSPVFEAMVKAPVNGPLDWILPKAAIELFESMGYVTIKDGKKWAFGGWLHEDKRT